ncbi:sigma-70 family RNA polymerase sigma factor [Streptomyces pseudogriseolus]|uniref:sigma-70 family RNA polymerase sigma factor n=1 Tax=Streptomyces pseudogriseolus TaxID=36817 RepID=UPI00348BD507|nr:sigma-70 family RNA polymerase sigma factor [Streptomyces pseudogriseolus]
MNTSLVASEFPPVEQARTVTWDITDLDDAASLFLRTRPSLLHIAHRIVGSPTEAEDVVQEAWARLQGTDRAAVHHPAALLRTITARLAMNVAQSARKRREFSASPTLPDRVDGRATPETVVERHDAVDDAVALLLATLTPNQRAAYLLREGFGCSYDRIAALLQLSVVNARQQVFRAQRRLDTGRRRQEVDSVAHRRLVQAFLGAARTGDLACLERVLLEDVC